MSINLLETVQQNLGYPALQKIDPNTQRVAAEGKIPEKDKFSQAAIPAVLTGLYKYVQSDEGAAGFLRGDNSPDWIATIFGDEKKKTVQAISTYANEPGKDAAANMNTIASEVVKVVKENLPAGDPVKEVKFFFRNQKNNILLYLPAELNMGELLHDTTLDDKTHKMGGPLSTLMQSIGNAFTNPVTDEETRN
jgi:hypothetical protein